MADPAVILCRLSACSCLCVTKCLTIFWSIHSSKNHSSSDVMEEDAILVSISTREAWNEYFYTPHSLAFALSRFTRVKYKRKRKEMASVPFLASASVFTFAVALMLLTRVFTCACVCVFVARFNQPYAWVAWLYTCALWLQHDVVGSV